MALPIATLIAVLSWSLTIWGYYHAIKGAMDATNSLPRQKWGAWEWSAVIITLVVAPIVAYGTTLYSLSN